MKKDPVKHPTQRVGVFVDASNMYFSAKHNFQKNVNFKNVLKTAVAERNLIRAFAYVIQSEEGKEASFFEALESYGYETRIKQLQIFSGGSKKGDWDVGMAIDVVRMLPILDVVVLISGDGDFVDLLDYVRGQGRRTEVMAFKQTTSSRLLSETDEFIDLGQDERRFLF